MSIPGLTSHHVWTSFPLDQMMKRICRPPTAICSLYSKRKRSGRTKAVVKGFSTVRLPPFSTNRVLTTPESRYDLQSVYAFDMRSIIRFTGRSSGFGCSTERSTTLRIPFTAGTGGGTSSGSTIGGGTAGAGGGGVSTSRIFPSRPSVPAFGVSLGGDAALAWSALLFADCSPSVCAASVWRMNSPPPTAAMPSTTNSTAPAVLSFISNMAFTTPSARAAA